MVVNTHMQDSRHLQVSPRRNRLASFCSGPGKRRTTSCQTMNDDAVTSAGSSVSESTNLGSIFFKSWAFSAWAISRVESTSMVGRCFGHVAES